MKPRVFFLKCKAKIIEIKLIMTPSGRSTPGRKSIHVSHLRLYTNLIRLCYFFLMKRLFIIILLPVLKSKRIEGCKDLRAQK